MAEEAVTMLEAQTEVAVNYHDVGMTPLNDLLKTKVELANARQDLVAAQNNLEIARADFNLLLAATHRHIGDTGGYPGLRAIVPVPCGMSWKRRKRAAWKSRWQIWTLRIREKELTLAKKDYYPTVQVQGNYYKLGTDWQVDGGEGIDDSNFWDVQAQARWDFWQWGKTGHGIAEKKSKTG